MDMNIGERIKEMRKQKGLTQKEFCERINCKQTKLSYIERGTNEPGISVISEICKAFNISADWLLFGDKDEGTANKPPEKNFSKPQQEIISITDRLTEQQQSELLGVIKMYLSMNQA